MIRKVVMESGGTLSSWIGQQVRVELRDVRPPGQAVFGQTPFEYRAGALRNVDEFGVELEQSVGTSGHTRLIFHPWSAVRSIELAT
jgi:hypothetical protein